MNTTPVFVPLIVRRWPHIGATTTKQPHQFAGMPLFNLISLDGAIFYMPVYLSLGLLKQDFPDAEVMELELPIEDEHGKTIKYSVKVNSDGQLIGETIEIPRLNASPQIG